MRIAVSLFLLLPLIAEAVSRQATRDESNWSNVKSYNEAVRRHPVNPNAISQVDSDDETRAVAYYYMIVNGTTIDREVRYFLAPYQVSAVGDLHIFFLPGPLANWARNIGSFDIDPSEILERYPPVSLNDLPPMPRMIRRKIRELTYGYDLLRSSGVSREKYGRERASNGATRVQSVDNSVATTVAPQFRPTRMIAPARQTVKPQQQPVISRRKFVPKFDRDEQSIFESIVNELVEHNESTLPPTKPSPKPTNSKVVRIGLGPATVARPLHRITTPKFKPTTPTAPPTADAALKEFTFRPHSTPSSRSVNEYDEEGEEKGETDDIPHSLPETKHLPSKKPSLDSDTPTRITHPRTHAIERNRIKEIIVGVDDARPPIQQRPAPKKRVEEDALSSAEIIEKLSTIRSLQAELERQLELKGKIGRKRVEAAHPDPNLIDLEDLSAPTRTTQEATEEPITTETTTEQPETTTMTTTEAPTTTTRRATTTTTTTHAPTTTRTTTRRPNTTTRPVAPPPLDEQDDVVPAAPPRDTEFHAFHEDLVGALESLDEDPQILPPLPSELFSGHSTHGSFFGGSERRVGQNERQKATTTTRRPTTMRTTTRRATTTTTRAPTTTTTTTEPTTTTTEATTEATTEVPSSTPFTLPTRKFVFVTQPPNTRAPTTTTTTTTTTTPAPFPTLISSGNALAPTVPEFVLDEASESSASPDDVKIDLRTLRALTSLSNDEIDKIRKRFVEVDARATAVKLAPGRELDEAMFRGLEMMEDFEARAQGATTLDEAEGGGVIAMEDLAPMSRRFVPMGMGGRLATAAAVKTKNMDVEYDYVEEKQGEEEDEKNPGRVLVFDDEMGAHVRDSRRIRLQHLNEPLRRFEKVNNGRRDKFVFVRPDRFYDKDGVELQKTKGINEAQLAEAIGLGSGRLVKIVSNDLQPNSHQSTAAEHSKTTTSAPLIGVPIHIAAVSLPSTRKLTPPPVSTTASPLGTRAQPHPPAHTPPVHLLPEQLQLLQLASARPVQQPKAVAVQIPSFLTPPPRPVQQVQQPLQPTVSTLPNIQPVHLPTQPTLVQPVQQQQQNSAAVQQVVTPPPQLAQVVFNQQPVAARVQTVQQPAAAAATTTVPPTTAAATVTTVQLSTVTSSQLQTTTTTPATTTTAAPAAAVTSAVAAPTPSAFLPNPAFRNPIHPSIPFTPALNGLSVNQFLAQFAAQQQAIRAAAKQLQQLQRTPKAVQQLQQPGAQQVQPVLQQQQQQFFWAPQPQFVPAPWFFPGAFGSKTARAGRPPGDVITVTKDTVPSNGSTSKPVVEIERP